MACYSARAVVPPRKDRHGQYPYLLVVALLALVFSAQRAWAQAPDVRFCSTGEGTVDDRIAACTRAIVSDQLSQANLAITLYNRGNAWRSKNDPDRAIADYNEAIRLSPQVAQAYNNRGTAWSDKRDPDRAIADYNEAIRLNPQYPPAYNNRGNAWRSKNEPDRAIADYTEAIRLDPQYAPAYNNRGNAWGNKNDLDRAIADYNEAIRLEPKHADAYKSRGRANFHLGRYTEAATDFEQGLSLVPRDTDAVLWRFLARARGGDVQNARAGLDAGFSKVAIKAWPAPVVEFLSGRIDSKALLQAAEHQDARIRGDQICELEFFVGQSELINGRTSEARSRLQRAAEICPKDFVEYEGAVAELRRLGN